MEYEIINFRDLDQWVVRKEKEKYKDYLYIVHVDFFYDILLSELFQILFLFNAEFKLIWINKYKSKFFHYIKKIYTVLYLFLFISYLLLISNLMICDYH